MPSKANTLTQQQLMKVISEIKTGVYTVAELVQMNRDISSYMVITMCSRHGLRAAQAKHRNKDKPEKKIRGTRERREDVMRFIDICTEHGMIIKEISAASTKALGYYLSVSSINSYITRYGKKEDKSPFHPYRMKVLSEYFSSALDSPYSKLNLGMIAEATQLNRGTVAKYYAEYCRLAEEKRQTEKLLDVPSFCGRDNHGG